LPKSRRPRPKAAPQSKTSFSVDVHSDPAVLEACGPLLRAAWWVPAAQEAALRSSGVDPSGPVPGSLLLDTGATRTAIALSVARELGLHPTRTVTGYGAAGKYELQAFFARLMMSFKARDRWLRLARE